MFSCSSLKPLYAGPVVKYFPSWFMPLLLAAMGLCEWSIARLASATTSFGVTTTVDNQTQLTLPHTLVAIIHLLILGYITFLIRFPIQLHCGCISSSGSGDLESQSSSTQRRSKYTPRSRKARALKAFDTSMSIMSVAYCLVAVLLTWWESVAGAEGLWPWKLSVSLSASLSLRRSLS